MFTPIDVFLPSVLVITYVYICLPMFTPFYSCLPIFNYV